MAKVELKSDTVLTPLAPYLAAEEWKEVIPMTAVLARKQAEPLMVSLVAEANKLRQAHERGQNIVGQKEWKAYHPTKLPAPVARLVQCLVEEAEATPETLIGALQAIAFFARTCQSADDWGALCRGPYGDELLHQAWLMYRTMDWPEDILLEASCSQFARLHYPVVDWVQREGSVDLERMLDSETTEEIARGLFLYAGNCLHTSENDEALEADVRLQPKIEAHLFQQDFGLAIAASYVWSIVRRQNRAALLNSSSQVLNRLLDLWLGSVSPASIQVSALAISALAGTPRGIWKPTLTAAQAELVEGWS
jgi:hypothetical protein